MTPVGSSSHLPSRPGPSLRQLLISKSFLRRARKATREHCQAQHQPRSPASSALPQPRAHLRGLHTRHRWATGREHSRPALGFAPEALLGSRFCLHTPGRGARCPWFLNFGGTDGSASKFRGKTISLDAAASVPGSASKALSLSLRTRGCRPSQQLRPLRKHFPSTTLRPDSESLELAPKEKAKVRKITLKERGFACALRAQELTDLKKILTKSRDLRKILPRVG